MLKEHGMKKRIAQWFLDYFREEIIDFLFDEEFVRDWEVIERCNEVKEEIEMEIRG